MGPSSTSGAGGFWYPERPEQEPARVVLNTLRDYRSAERDMRRRTSAELGINEKDMQALRHLMRAHRQGISLGPTDLSRLLNISTASTTALIDRLVSSGHVQRQLHPTDRRALELIPTLKSDSEVRDVLGPMHERMMAAAASLSPAEAATVAAFLQRLTDAVDEKPEPAMPANQPSPPAATD